MDEEEVFEFGVARDGKPRMFKDSTWLGFKTNYRYFVGHKVLVGNGYFSKAIDFISATLTEDTSACRTYVGTVVICMCEGARFIPLFAEFTKNDWGVLPEWAWTLIQNWEKSSEVARKERKLYEAPGVLDNEVLETLIKNSGWCADNIFIQHRHQEFRKSSEQASTSSSSEQPQVQMRAEDAPQEHHLLYVATTVQELFTNARTRSGLSLLELGKELKISADLVGRYESGMDKRSPNKFVLKRLKDMYSLKLSLKR